MMFRVCFSCLQVANKISYCNLSNDSGFGKIIENVLKVTVQQMLNCKTGYSKGNKYNMLLTI